MSLEWAETPRGHEIVILPLTRRQRRQNAADPSCELCGGIGTLGVLRRADDPRRTRTAACPCTEGNDQ